MPTADEVAPEAEVQLGDDMTGGRGLLAAGSALPRLPDVLLGSIIEGAVAGQSAREAQRVRASLALHRTSELEFVAKTPERSLALATSPGFRPSAIWLGSSSATQVEACAGISQTRGMPADDLPITCSALDRHGVTEGEIRHAVRNMFARREDVGKHGLLMLYGATASGRLLEVGIADADEPTRARIVHADDARLPNHNKG